MPRKAKPTAKRKRKARLRDLPAGRKARGVKAGALISSYQPQGPDALKPGISDTLGGKFTCIPES